MSVGLERECSSQARFTLLFDTVTGNFLLKKLLVEKNCTIQTLLYNEEKAKQDAPSSVTHITYLIPLRASE